MFDYSDLKELCKGSRLQDLTQTLDQESTQWSSAEAHGDAPRWRAALEGLPELPVSGYALNRGSVTISGEIDSTQARVLETALREFHPWRKGPFELFGIHIDTEWRSDWKWDRLKDAIDPLRGRTVLDVGCGSGYHCWRMAGAGARCVIGIEPMLLYVYQYQALRRYLGQPPVWVVPYRMEQLPTNLNAFDTVFSLGVLYHRRSPLDHLVQLKTALKPGGQLVLETLVTDGDEHTVLMPGERYASMGNVWFLPSPAMLKTWLQKLKFTDVRLVDVNQTGIEEQRSTQWMTFNSLADFLDPQDHSRTIENYPAPKRAIMTAYRPP